jgi:hypothetical protein
MLKFSMKATAAEEVLDHLETLLEKLAAETPEAAASASERVG